MSPPAYQNLYRQADELSFTENRAIVLLGCYPISAGIIAPVSISIYVAYYYETITIPIILTYSITAPHVSHNCSFLSYSMVI